MAEDAFAPWMAQAQQSAQHLHDRAEDTEALRRWATATINECRQQLKLKLDTAPVNDLLRG
ncbi:hypothetical protein [Streptomyces hypolithicus]